MNESINVKLLMATLDSLPEPSHRNEIYQLPLREFHMYNAAIIEKTITVEDKTQIILTLKAVKRCTRRSHCWLEWELVL